MVKNLKGLHYGSLFLYTSALHLNPLLCGNCLHWMPILFMLWHMRVWPIIYFWCKHLSTANAWREIPSYPHCTIALSGLQNLIYLYLNGLFALCTDQISGLHIRGLTIYTPICCTFALCMCLFISIYYLFCFIAPVISAAYLCTITGN